MRRNGPTGPTSALNTTILGCRIGSAKIVSASWVLPYRHSQRDFAFQGHARRDRRFDFDLHRHSGQNRGFDFALQGRLQRDRRVDFAFQRHPGQNCGFDFALQRRSEQNRGFVFAAQTRTEQNHLRDPVLPRRSRRHVGRFLRRIGRLRLTCRLRLHHRRHQLAHQRPDLLPTVRFQVLFLFVIQLGLQDFPPRL